MSNPNLPTEQKDNTTSPQTEAASSMGKVSKAVGGHIGDIRGNAKWELVKYLYNNRGAVLAYLYVGWAAMNTVVAYLIRHFRGEPIDWLIIGLLALVSVIPIVMLTFVLLGKRRERAALNPEVSMTAMAETMPVSEVEQFTTSDAKALEKAQDAAADWQAKHGVLQSERDASRVDLNTVTEERDRLLEVVGHKEQMIEGLRDDVSLYKTPQLDIIHKKEPPYWVEYEHGKRKRVEIYVGVTSRIPISDLRVEMGGIQPGGPMSARIPVRDTRIPLREKDDAEPYRQIFTIEPGDEILFHLASYVTDDTVFHASLEVHTTEPIPEGFRNGLIYIIAHSSHTLPCQKTAIFTYTGRPPRLCSFNVR
jgi:hypothetical protein